jgi:ABC-type transport system involved in cytochrome c biogenesis permease subunit
MKNKFPLLTLVAAGALLALAFVPPKNSGGFDVAGFGRLPVLTNGRIKPFDTVARTTLLQLQGRQRVTTPDHRSLEPTEWLLDLLCRPSQADNYQTFEVVHPELLALLNLTPDDGAAKKRFSLHQLSPALKELEKQANLAEPVESAARSSFQNAVVQLRDRIMHYQSLQLGLVSPDSPDFFPELQQVESAPAGPQRKIAMEHVIVMAASQNFLAVPPSGGESGSTGWESTGSALLRTLKNGQVHPTALRFAEIAHAWNAGDAASFNRLVAAQRASLESRFAPELRKANAEVRFNTAQPFYQSTILYVIAFLLGVFSWLKWPGPLSRAAFWVVVLAFAIATVGLAMRMWLEGRPPVTNLYSSALFVGWVAVALCLVLEAIYRNAIGSVAAGLIGFSTLLIAHHLALSGDTLEMMRAVLDSNFWLATHVVTVTVGYSATFLAGFLAVIFVLRGACTKSLDSKTADALARMVYGIVCFATLFSFVGTVLGGIWADQSWGRFWGWDPKENGALIIVLWNALVLHARWGGIVKQRGLMALAVFGNVVTAWSWFGVNMLGVGLHSYGFMDAAFWWLVAFVLSQFVIIALATLPLARWRSFQNLNTVRPPSAPARRHEPVASFRS